MRSIVKVSNIYGEDLFNWFYCGVRDSCGDGAAMIVCENYEEVAKWFTVWWRNDIEHSQWYRGKDFYHPFRRYDNVINFHDSNESFMFSDAIPNNFFSGDYIYVVEGDCPMNGVDGKEKRVIKAIQC